MAENNFGSLHYNAIGPWLKNYFGERVVKLSLDGGFTCPNRDGRAGSGGCIFCSADGSGRFAGSVDEEIQLYRHKWPEAVYIAYFQNFTNTYAPAGRLLALWDGALARPGIKGLAVATRPDCLPDEVLELLAEFNRKTFLWVELGLQSASDETGRLINRCYETRVYEEACAKLNALGIRHVTHLIMGLPGENREQMLDSAAFAAAQKPFGLKLHMLHIMKGTRLAELYPELELMSLEEYVGLICDILETTPPEITIHRLTGDAPGAELLAPEWTRNKHNVLNAIQHEFKIRGTYQGCRLK